ncbi:protein NUCLEAR FUSION DEFECTIVE 4 [Cryptomeria japonica]|uniref:protein NUCLEAR FUSION DEFECTIVE 4 n=1 Tax=Cryptomeria japonica TaxID=3369 RepID=UPI0027DA9A66|nr:protein NUCLEAR FUSION DEFECTIVE 4 [Cryptomeria japonica]
MGSEFLSNRWIVLVACIWIECCAGASYSFSLYSQTIKTRFSYTQQQLDIISVLKDTGECIGIISGLLYDRFPPWLVLLVGAAQNSVGYMVIWLYVTGRLATPALWEMCVFICVAINGQTYYNTASIVTCVNNFPGNRGIVVGLMKGCLGLSSAILSTAWRLVFPESDGSSFLLVAAIVPSVVALVLTPIVRKHDPVEFKYGSSATTVRLGMVSAPVVVLALFLMGFSLWGRHSFQASDSITVYSL